MRHDQETRRTSMRILTDRTSTGFDLSGYGNVSTRVALCTFYGRSNLRAGIIMAAIIVFLGLIRYPLSLQLQRHGYG